MPEKYSCFSLFQKRIDGDDALLQLARHRFKEAGLGMEVCTGSYDELQWLLGFKPWPGAPVIVHLPRELDLFAEESRRIIGRMASKAGKSVYGMVVHDQAEACGRSKEYAAALLEMNGLLEAVPGGPMLFVEYAAGLEPESYCEILGHIKDAKRVSGCIDIGHIGIRQARKNYRQKYSNVDICSLKPTDRELPAQMEDVELAAHDVLQTVLYVIGEVGRIGKPVHFHIHDAHPLWSFSPFGVSDHLGFFEKIDIPFQHKGANTLSPMFGPAGLSRIVAKIKEVLPPERVSFCLEIHPTGGKLPLSNDIAHLFHHWTDKTNAEKMNHWLSILVRNHNLLKEICEKLKLG